MHLIVRYDRGCARSQELGPRRRPVNCGKIALTYKRPNKRERPHRPLTLALAAINGDFQGSSDRREVVVTHASGSTL
jgi:hypothetical protein